VTETATQEAKTKVRIEIPGVEGSGAQVFEGDTEAEVLGKLQQAQEHASRKIREQQQQITDMEARYTPQPSHEPPADGFNANGYFETLYKDPRQAFDQMFEQRFGMSIKDAVTGWQNMQAAAEFVNVNKVGHALMAKHPELGQVTPDERNENAAILDKLMTENKWEYTLGNLEAAYAVAATQGKLKLPTKEPAHNEPPPSPPATLGSGSGGQEQVNEQELLRNMTADQMKEYFIEKHKNFQRSA